MQTTGKKFFDKKNILANQDQNPKPTFQKNQQNKNNFLQSLQEKDRVFSKPYKSQDEYANLETRFETGSYDIGYQTFENAFPFRSQFNADFRGFGSSQEGSEFQQLEFNFGEINPCREFKPMELAAIPIFGEEQIGQLEWQNGSSESQQSLDQQQSTKENSNSYNQETE